MDAFHYDNYSYSDASTPRTPSPRTDMHPSFHSPHANFKPQVDIAVHRSIFDHHGDDAAIVPETHALEAAHMWSHPYPSYPQPPGSRGSLLDELYENDVPEHNNIPHDIHPVDNHHYQHSADPQYHGGNWSNLPQTAHDQHHIQPPMRHAHDVAMTRRATFPYVRHDRPEVLPYPPHPFMNGGEDSLHGSPYNSRPGTVYGEPLPMDGSPHMHMTRDGLHHLDEPFAHSVPMGYDIKTEEQGLVVPSQAAYCRPPSAGMHPLPCLSPHAGLLVQHTDDAASKETQYLRRRCFNCHTTEPPSWRRSTLNPGKIVCNKCGLYERTHLRPRPLRFDELRAGSKTRKQPKVAGANGAATGAGSPKAGKLTQMVKKEAQGEDGAPMIQRRSSVSSSASSVHSGSATSDWDDNGSAPPSSFNSPAVSSFSIPRDPNSQSPPLPRDGGIRLPNAPLSDIASLQSSSPAAHPASIPPTPRKAATAPTPFYQTQQGFYPNGNAAAAAAQSERRGSGSMPLTASPQMQTQSPHMQGQGPAELPPMPEVTGWQSVPMSDLSSSPKPGSANGVKSRSNSLRNSITAA